MIYKLKVNKDESEVLVADLIKSLTVYTVFDMKLKLKAKYPNGQWCFDMIPITITNAMFEPVNCYLSCDFDKNLIFLKKFLGE